MNTKKFATATSVKKHFEQCRSLEFVSIFEEGVRIRFHYANGVTVLVDAKNEAIEPFM